MNESNALHVKTVEIDAGQPLVLPDEFRRGLGLDTGGQFTVVQLDGIVLLSSKRLVSLEILEKIRGAMNENAVTLDDLLEGLAKVREQIYRERYEPSAQTA